MDNDDVVELTEFVELTNQVLSPFDLKNTKVGRLSDKCDSMEEVVEGGGAVDHKNSTMWAVHGKNYFGCSHSVKTLESGQYTANFNGNGEVFLTLMPMTLDSLLELPDSASEEIIKAIDLFWKKEEHFKKHGFVWKRGVLLWGPPGGGKTSTLQLIAKRVHDMGGISLTVTTPHAAEKALHLIRQIEPNRPLVVFLEDIDAMVHEYGESRLLALLDGELQIDKVVFVATTNYPERMDKRFINRPSRFDIVKKIGMPSESARELYLSTKNPRLIENPSELKLWVEKTKGYSIAHMKELITSVECFEVSFENALGRLNAMMTNNPKSDDTGNSIGFHNN